MNINVYPKIKYSTAKQNYTIIYIMLECKLTNQHNKRGKNMKIAASLLLCKTIALNMRAACKMIFPIVKIP